MKNILKEKFYLCLYTLNGHDFSLIEEGAEKKYSKVNESLLREN